MIELVKILIIGLIIFSSLFILAYPIHIFLTYLKNKRFSHITTCEDAISILVPVKGLDEGAFDNYQSYFDQILPDGSEIIFSVEDEEDPAVPILKQICELNSLRRSKIIFSGKDDVHEGKMHNLTEGLKHAEGKLIVFIDSDVRLTNASYIYDFVTPLYDTTVGMVTCFQACYKASTLGSGLIGIMSNADMVGYFSTLYVYDRLDVANGAVLALKKESLEEIGGLKDLRNTILNDTGLARKVTASGKKIAFSLSPARIYSHKSTIREWWRQATRWHVAMYSYMNLFEYFLYAITRLGLFFSMLYIFLSNGSLTSMILASCVIAARTVSFAVINGFIIKDKSSWKYFGLIYLIDLLNIVFILKPVFSKKIFWRGRSYLVQKNAYLKPFR